MRNMPTYNWVYTITCSNDFDVEKERKVLYTKLPKSIEDLCMFGYTGVRKLGPMMREGDLTAATIHGYLPMALDQFLDIVDYNALRVYLAYSALRDKDTLEAWCSEHYVATWLNITRKQVEKAKARLRKCGLMAKYTMKFREDIGRRVAHVKVFGHIYEDYVFLDDDVFFQMCEMKTISEKKAENSKNGKLGNKIRWGFRSVEEAVPVLRTHSERDKQGEGVRSDEFLRAHVQGYESTYEDGVRCNEQEEDIPRKLGAHDYKSGELKTKIHLRDVIQRS